MNENSMNKVIGDYAIENANLRICIARLEEEIEALKSQTQDEETSTQ